MIEREVDGGEVRMRALLTYWDTTKLSFVYENEESIQE